MTNLPPPYLERMQRLLGREFDAFLEIYSRPPSMGLRVNPLKITVQDFQAIAPFPLTPLAWCPAGFTCNPDANASPGKHPYHAAGLYYLQDPSAMATVELLSPQPGEWVLDLAAAPGGKTTHIASLMQQKGILYANETHPRRVWEMAENLERWGVTNAVILNESAERLAREFEGCFDRVLLDAPCSGEGMFRKSQIAIREWSPQRVESCAYRQAGILESATRLLAPGGVLVYSTCTFSPQENEGVIARFLDHNTDFEVAAVHRLPGVSPGRPDWIEESLQVNLPHALLDSITQAWRLWPQHGPGEGHFAILLNHTGEKPDLRNFRKRVVTQVPPESARLFKDFSDRYLTHPLPEMHLYQTGSYLYAIPPDLLETSRVKVVHPGLWLGVIKKDRFEPAHALALSLNREQVKSVISLEIDEAVRYLRGETLVKKATEGWVSVAFDGYPIGWGKSSQDVIKNYYPKGLRWL